MSRTNIRMGVCSTGRSTQKYSSGGSLTLQDVLENGNVTTIGIQTPNPIISNTLTLSGVSKGDILYAPQDGVIQTLSIGPTNNVLTVTSQSLGTLSWEPPQGTGGGGGGGNLEGVTLVGAFTNQTILFQHPTTGFTVSSNAVVTGNVTADYFAGDGSNITGIPQLSVVTQLRTDVDSNTTRINNLELANIVQEGLIDDLTSNLTSNVTRISDLETATIISSSSGITGVHTGDILYASGVNTLQRLAIGTTSGLVLKVDNGLPSWGSVGGAGSLWSQDAAKLYYTGGPVGIGNTAALTNQTLQVGSNVSISDTGADKLSVSGNIYVSKNLTVADDINANEVHARKFFVKNVEVVAERPVKQI
tara:strand:+ start:1014 stop:2096 length:1083 start_codon:yes stop_codon:yes gene_type:complete